MEIIVATLAVLAIFQLFQLPGRQQEKQARESLELITAPVETAPTERRIRLLLDADEPEASFRTFAPVTVYSPIIAEVEPVEAALAEAVETVTSAPVVEAVPVAETASVIAAPTSDVTLLLDTVEVPAERVRAEDEAILQGKGVAAATAQATPDTPTTEAVPPSQKPRTAAASRREQVFKLLDDAAAQGISGYAALTEYVKQHSGQGTSRSTIKAWKDAREAATVLESKAHG